LRRSALSAQLAFRGGRNIALMVPPRQFDRTAGSDRGLLGLEQPYAYGRSEAFGFGRHR
jgi:hypothetical protein